MICLPAIHARRQVKYWYSLCWHSPRICLILIKQYLHYPLKLVWNPCYYTKCNIFPLLNKLFLFYKHLLLVFISWAWLAVNTPLRRGHYEWGINVCPRHLKHMNSIFSVYYWNERTVFSTLSHMFLYSIHTASRKESFVDVFLR